MSRKKPDKKIAEFQAEFETILICNEKRLKPFIEAFVQEPENIGQQNLGTLFGVLEVADETEDSSYIVNYLISVIEKEYFSKPKRGAVESLEAALHKANLALSKLAEHGNISWLGKINALVAVIEKNGLHLSQTGTASAFLLRSKALTDISEGLAPEEPEPHPLKTFVNVSSGRMEKDDKLIVTTDSIFEIFSLEEIKKSALRFSDEEFARFLRTALVNELPKAAVLVAKIREKVEPEMAPAFEMPEEFNAFSQNTFFRKYPEGKKKSPVNEDQISNIEVSQKKNGHIYIKASENILPERPRTAIFDETKERLVSAGESLGGMVKKNLWQKTKKLFTTKTEKPVAELEIIEEPVLPKEKVSLKMRLAGILAVLGSILKFIQKTFLFVKRLLPDFSRLAAVIKKMNYQQKIYALLVVIAIFVVPFFAIKIQDWLKEKNTTTETPVVEVAPLPLEADKNVVRVENLNSFYSGENVLSATNLNGKIFAVSAKNVFNPEDQQSYSLPEDFGTLKIAVGMDDLNIILLLNENSRVLAWSPVSKNFQNNSLQVPESSRITAAGTYLTYIYLVDAQSSQIYRYPRAEGGFGAKADWLKNKTDLSGVTGMALTDNIYLASSNGLGKFFRGEKQDFTVETTATPIVPFKVYVRIDSQNIFVLDKQNARVIKLDISGMILSQYYNGEIASANDFTVDETSNTAYISTANKVFSFLIN